jgi:hypothetical protein
MISVSPVYIYIITQRVVKTLALYLSLILDDLSMAYIIVCTSFQQHHKAEKALCECDSAYAVALQLISRRLWPRRLWFGLEARSLPGVIARG